MLLRYLDDNRSVDLSIIMDIPAFDMWSDGGSDSCSLWQYYDNMTIILLSYLMIIMSQCSSLLWQYDVQILPWYVHEGGSEERGENVSQRSTRLVLHLHILWFAFDVFCIFCIMHFACFVFCMFCILHFLCFFLFCIFVFCSFFLFYICFSFCFFCILFLHSFDNVSYKELSSHNSFPTIKVISQ